MLRPIPGDPWGVETKRFGLSRNRDSCQVNVLDYKNLIWVLGADRKFRSKGHEALRELPNSDPEGRKVLSAPNTHILFFSCIRLISNASFIIIHNDVDVGHLSRLMTKPTKWHMRPAKTQISLGIRPVLSVFASA